MKKANNYTQKFYKVSHTSKDGVKFNDLVIGNTPAESLENAKKGNIGHKGFKVGKTAFNTLGEKF